MTHGSLAEEAKRGEGVHAETRDPRSTRGGATTLALAMAAIAGVVPPITKTTSGTYTVTLGQTDADREALAAAEAKRGRKNARRLALRVQSEDK